MIVSHKEPFFHLLKKGFVLRPTLLIVVLIFFLLSGCASHKELTLMPTPVLYHNSTIDPFAHLSPVHKTTTTEIFYATNRVPTYNASDTRYKNQIDSTIHFGKATIGMGSPGVNWDKLRKLSLANQIDDPIPLTLELTVELATIPNDALQVHQKLPPELQTFIDSINAELDAALDKEIMLYVHGTKVDFANSVILTAEVDHFAGRDFIGVAFAWPSHQNILSYLFGTDVRRALDSSQPLHQLITLLSEHTTAEHINILAYSAGCRIASKALHELREAHAEVPSHELKEKFRLGAVVFAAADVEVDVFTKRLTKISELADQVVVTVTDNDNALQAAKRFMGGTYRAGTTEGEKKEISFIEEHRLSNIEIIDVSLGKQERNFDITGHHYWYRHPWMSSDIIFLLRTDLPPSRRGLSPADHQSVWYLSADYPGMVQRAAQIELNGTW